MILFVLLLVHSSERHSKTLRSWKEDIFPLQIELYPVDQWTFPLLHEI